MSISRPVSKIFKAIETKEGVGSTVFRSIGSRKLKSFAPFLLLDHFAVADSAGFPDHPHRGMETITYLLDGQIVHEDFTGSYGILNPGDLQFMTAGRGIIHAEMPFKDLNKKIDNNSKPRNILGIQLWVDLPKKLKMTEPRYRDLKSKEIPIINIDKNGNILNNDLNLEDKNAPITIKIISGEFQGIKSVRDLSYTPVWFFDVILRNKINSNGNKNGNESIFINLPNSFNAFVYVLKGNAYISGELASEKDFITLERVGDYKGVEISTVNDKFETKDISQNKNYNDNQETRLFIIGGEYFEQPIIQHGPFVMNSEKEIMEAIEDFYYHRNGFERGLGWESKISKQIDL